MKKVARFIIKKQITPALDVCMEEYDMEYYTLEELHTLFQESREVWAEYFVEVHTELYTMKSIIPYKDSL